ncbi:hypothetical protein YC2023_095694 [Brassica napus]
MPCNHHHKKINTERLAGSALNLVTQLLNWRACFQAWITSQRSYVLSLTSWLLRCDFDKSHYQRWSRLFKGLNEKHVVMVDKLHFFASMMSSIFSLKKLCYAEWRSYVSVNRSDSYHGINRFRGMHVIPEYVFGSVRTNRSVLRTQFFTRINGTAAPITNSNP